MRQTILIIVICLVSLVALVMVAIQRADMQRKKAYSHSWGIDELRKGDLKLYVSEAGIYRLDPNRAEWTLAGRGYSGQGEQDVAIRDGQAYYADISGIYTTLLGDGTAPRTLFAGVSFSPDMLAISWDGRFIAYRKYLDNMYTSQAVIVRDLQSGDEKLFPIDARPDGICWSGDGKSLILGCETGIIRLILSNGQQEPVCQGASPQASRDGSLYYFRPADQAGGRVLLFFRRNMETGSETEVARVPVAGFEAAAVDPSGRFLAVGYMTSTRLVAFDLQTIIQLTDLQTGKQCWLPVFDRVTQCILWQGNKVTEKTPVTQQNQ